MEQQTISSRERIWPRGKNGLPGIEIERNEKGETLLYCDGEPINIFISPAEYIAALAGFGARPSGPGQSVDVEVSVKRGFKDAGVENPNEPIGDDEDEGPHCALREPIGSDPMMPPEDEMPPLPLIGGIRLEPEDPERDEVAVVEARAITRFVPPMDVSVPVLSPDAPRFVHLDPMLALTGTQNVTTTVSAGTVTPTHVAGAALSSVLLRSDHTHAEPGDWKETKMDDWKKPGVLVWDRHSGQGPWILVKKEALLRNVRVPSEKKGSTRATPIAFEAAWIVKTGVVDKTTNSDLAAVLEESLTPYAPSVFWSNLLKTAALAALTGALVTLHAYKIADAEFLAEIALGVFAILFTTIKGRQEKKREIISI